MKFRFIFLLPILLSSDINILLSQGCSDAGACSIESFSAKGEESYLKNEITLGLSYGVADHSIGVLGAQLGYTRNFGSSFSMDAKLTYAVISGNDINESGFGDVFIIAN